MKFSFDAMDGKGFLIIEDDNGDPVLMLDEADVESLHDVWHREMHPIRVAREKGRQGAKRRQHAADLAARHRIETIEGADFQVQHRTEALGDPRIAWPHEYECATAPYLFKVDPFASRTRPWVIVCRDTRTSNRGGGRLRQYQLRGHYGSLAGAVKGFNRRRAVLTKLYGSGEPATE